MAKPTALTEESRGGDLCRVRLAARLTSRQLAFMLDVSQSHFSRIERGVSSGDAEFWSKVRELFPEFGHTSSQPVMCGERVQAARIAAGFSRARLARMVGVVDKTIKLIEENVASPIPATIMELEKVLGSLGYEGKEKQ